MGVSNTEGRELRIGWASTDITPERPVMIAGQFHVRISEGVADTVTATALALGSGTDHAVLVSCDLVTISDELRDAVRRRVAEELPDVVALKIVLNGTHTHDGPEVRNPDPRAGNVSTGTGVDLDFWPPGEYVDWASSRIAEAVVEAWQSRKPGGIAFGLAQAVVGRNRRWVDRDGTATMYGNTDTATFSHVEGYEDHNVNVMATYSASGELSGLVVNVPCPSQATENLFEISADYWHETRLELRRRFGESLFVLPQCSSAGDQSPRPLVAKSPEQRMLDLKGRTLRQEIAVRIADAVADVLTHVGSTVDNAPILAHHVETLGLPMTRLDEAAVAAAQARAEELRGVYEEELGKLEADPELRNQARWYVPVTRAFRRMKWNLGVVQRCESQKTCDTRPAEVHVIRVGDMVFATNPFEYYLDHGMHIKARSPAAQTFVVQLAGSGTYVPSRRSLAGGGYGSIPASNPVGPEGGEMLANYTVERILAQWAS